MFKRRSLVFQQILLFYNISSTSIRLIWQIEVLYIKLFFKCASKSFQFSVNDTKCQLSHVQECHILLLCPVSLTIRSIFYCFYIIFLVFGSLTMHYNCVNQSFISFVVNLVRGPKRPGSYYYTLRPFQLFKIKSIHL